ncbi:MAG: GntR family transcriptional regulator [Atopobiaceae bacterium]|nr:GntR family transcriptional regulator [Atopobiaceae bacterium]MCH4181165.1 GntR family transcriptional regulator [Atopobiaceae bacterium]MCH4215169.1 GntR family transcriptional regulator [Atopobiaceae bacterium]MCH4277022.1 GntR family transcriptional regulator [Atopobiaceae bacterium]MCI1226134.1 GntR family transcriptional regulator [Atopobiaceae bacterium]
MPDAMTPGSPLVSADDLDQASSTPLYRQLADVLRSRIGAGRLTEGDRLPTEQSLSRDLGIGVSTVRGAYALLVDEGLVIRRAGRGSFVSHPKLDRDLHGLYNFTTEVRLMGMEPSSELLDFHEEAAGTDMAAVLGIHPTDIVYRVVRVRRADGRPLLLERSCVPEVRCPGLTRADVEGSLYEAIVRRSGVALASAHEVHEASVLTADEAATLNRKAGSATFRITRQASDVHGKVCERCEVVAPGDATRYVMDLGMDGSTAAKKVLVP